MSCTFLTRGVDDVTAVAFKSRRSLASLTPPCYLNRYSSLYFSLQVHWLYLHLLKLHKFDVYGTVHR